jgi:hypothetical protein
MQIVPSHEVPNPPSVGPVPRVVGRPIELYDVVTLQPNSEQAFKSRAFENTLKTPIELHRMVMAIQVLPASGVAASPSSLAGIGMIAFQLTVGRKDTPMTRGFVPAWLLTPSYNRTLEDGTATTFGSTQMTWKFRTPVVIRPGEGVTVQAKHLGYIQIPATVHVVFAGNVVPRSDPTARVPYVFHWASKNFGYTEAGTDTSPPAALANDTGRPLHIERIIGRNAIFGALAVSPNNPVLTDFSLSNDYTSVRMALSNDRPILRNFTAWNGVFNMAAAIEADFTMVPGDFVTASIQHAAEPTLTSAYSYFNTQGLISLVGSREE